jgi:hypothetical protein
MRFFHRPGALVSVQLAFCFQLEKSELREGSLARWAMIIRNESRCGGHFGKSSCREDQVSGVRGNVARTSRLRLREIHFSLFFCTVVLLLSKVLTVCWIGHRDVVVLNLLSGINSATVDGGSTHREIHPSLGTTILQHGSLKVTKRVGLSHWPRTCATAPCLFYCNANEKQP